MAKQDTQSAVEAASEPIAQPTTKRVVYIGGIPEGVQLAPAYLPSSILMKPGEPVPLPVALADEILDNQPVNYKEA